MQRVSILKRKFSAKPYKKEKKKTLQEDELNRITDEKKFWNTMKSFLDDKITAHSKYFSF